MILILQAKNASQNNYFRITFDAALVRIKDIEGQTFV